MKGLIIFRAMTTTVDGSYEENVESTAMLNGATARRPAGFLFNIERVA
jgi:hypothetical protein